MKVLQVIDSLPTGGGARFVVNLTKGLNKKQIHTDVLLLDGDETSFYKELKQTVSNIFVLTRGRRWSPLNVLKIIPYFKKYDIVHVHIFPGSYFVSLAKFLSGSKIVLVFTEHNAHNRRAIHPVFNYIESFVYKRFDAVVGISSPVKKFILNNISYPKDKIHTIYNGVDLETIKSSVAHKRSEFGFDNLDFIVIMVGRFTAQKDHDTLVKAFSELPENFKLILLGSGPRQSEVKGLCGKLDIHHRVKFLDDREDIYSIIKMSDIIVQSSHYEGFGLAVVEAMACGLPVIGTDVDGLNEVIGEYGLTFPIGKVAILRKMLQDLSKDKELYEKFSSMSMARAKYFDNSLMVDNYIKLYQTLLDNIQNEQ